MTEYDYNDKKVLVEFQPAEGWRVEMRHHATTSLGFSNCDGGVTRLKS